MWRVERTIAGVDASRDEVLPFVGPAVSLPLWSLFARLPFEAARNAWLVLLALALAVLVLASLRVAGRPVAWTDACCALLLGAVSGPAISALALGQAALVSAAAVALTFALLDRRSPWSVVTACIATIQPNLALALGARASTRRNALMLFLAGTVFLALTFFLGGGPAGFAAYLHLLADHGASERFILIQYGMPAILATFGVAPRAALIAGTALGMLAFGAALAAAVRYRDQPAYVAAIVTALVPLLVPFFHEHDFAIELVPAIVLAGAPSPRVRALAGIAAVCVLVDWLAIAQRPSTAAQTACLALAAACAYAALCDRTDERAVPFAAPAACAVLLACAVPFALAHLAPVWPDALGAFHAPADLNVSAVWAAEQRQSGLDRLESAWGILRLLPLCGCALFGLAGFCAARER